MTQPHAGPYDVVVVGGGPSGAAAAITCADLGLDVVLLDAAPPAGERRGEGLHPGVEVVLRQLGVPAQPAGAVRHAGHWVEWGGPPRFEAFGGDAEGPWLGYQVLREAFDAALLARAERAGAQVRSRCPAAAALVDGGRVTGVLTGSGAVPARVVLDASGRRSWLARQLHLPLVRHSRRLVAAYGHCRGSCPERDEAPALRADETGWTWTARVSPDTYAWVRVDVDPAAPWGRRPPDLAGLTPLGRARGADVTWRALAEPVGPGYVVAGDACAVLDPAAGHGVLRALMSGVAAARCAAATLRGGAGAAAATAGYRRWSADWFRADLRRLDQHYGVFPAWR